MTKRAYLQCVGGHRLVFVAFAWVFAVIPGVCGDGKDDASAAYRKLFTDHLSRYSSTLRHAVIDEIVKGAVRAINAYDSGNDLHDKPYECYKNQMKWLPPNVPPFPFPFFGADVEHRNKIWKEICQRIQIEKEVAANLAKNLRDVTADEAKSLPALAAQIRVEHSKDIKEQLEACVKKAERLGLDSIKPNVCGLSEAQWKEGLEIVARNARRSREIKETLAKLETFPQLKDYFPLPKHFSTREPPDIYCMAWEFVRCQEYRCIPIHKSWSTLKLAKLLGNDMIVPKTMSPEDWKTELKQMQDATEFIHASNLVERLKEKDFQEKVKDCKIANCCTTANNVPLR
eukprot:GHVT01095884.1.p1 GENE.GHVT01095884.1~~GHVT01095884.1.p1  ORF type:complete len:343 (-),score=25.82 GHVT01095884.1:473-1501(-)